MTRSWRPVRPALALMVLGLVVPAAGAAGPSGDVHAKFRAGGIVIIPAAETVSHDLYVAGSEVHVDGPLHGDLFVLRGTVEISDPVTGDLFMSGSNVSVTSRVGRHLRVAAGDASVDGPVAVDLLALVGNLSLSPTARVGGGSLRR